jgi:hypothetical protein
MADPSKGGITRTTGVMFRRSFGVASAPFALETSSQTRTAPQRDATVLIAPLLSRADGSGGRELATRQPRAPPKPRPRPKPNPLLPKPTPTFTQPKMLPPAATRAELADLELIGIMDEAARSQLAAAGGTGTMVPVSTGASEEELAYQQFLDDHPEWYVVLPDDATILQKVLAGPRSIWLYFVRLGEVGAPLRSIKAHTFICATTINVPVPLQVRILAMATWVRSSLHTASTKASAALGTASPPTFISSTRSRSPHSFLRPTLTIASRLPSPSLVARSDMMKSFFMNYGAAHIQD